MPIQIHRRAVHLEILCEYCFCWGGERGGGRLEPERFTAWTKALPIRLAASGCCEDSGLSRDSATLLLVFFFFFSREYEIVHDLFPRVSVGVSLKRICFIKPARELRSLSARMSSQSKSRARFYSGLVFVQEIPNDRRPYHYERLFPYEVHLRPLVSRESEMSVFLLCLSPFAQYCNENELVQCLPPISDRQNLSYSRTGLQLPK